MAEELYEQMKQTVIDGEVEEAEALAQKGLDAGLPPGDILDKGFVKGIEEVGDLFGKGEFFLPELVQGAEAMKAAVAVLQPAIDAAGGGRRTLGVAVAGTVAGDIHEIGKTIVCSMLSAAGFTVTDVGCDVPVETFVARCKETNADLLLLSALLTTTMPNQQKTIEALKAAGLRDSRQGDDRRRPHDPRLGRRDRRRRLRRGRHRGGGHRQDHPRGGLTAAPGDEGRTLAGAAARERGRPFSCRSGALTPARRRRMCECAPPFGRVEDAWQTDHDAYFEEVEARFENALDFDLGLEEEFHVLDPETFELTPGFEALREAAGERLRERIAGELLRSEIEVSTPRTLHFGQAAKQLLLNRAELFALADREGYALGATGTHPFSAWKDQQIIDTPHYRLVEDRLKYVAWRNNTWAAHVHVGVRGCDRAVAVCDALRTYLPHLLALSANSPFIEGVWTQLHSARTQTFVRMFPRCGIPDVFGTWAEHRGFYEELIDTNCIQEFTQIWWSVRPHHRFGTVEVRICDAQTEAWQSLAISSLTVGLIAHLARVYDEGHAAADPARRATSRRTCGAPSATGWTASWWTGRWGRS